MTEDDELKIVTDALPAAAVRCARDQTFLWVNPCYAGWVARPIAQIIGRRLAEVIGREAMREIEPYIERVLAGEQVQYERLAKFPGLGERWVNWTYQPAADGWVAIGTDIHDLKLAEQALKAEYQKKDEFLAALAHELRNPLAPIRNAVAILARKGSQDPEVAWSLDAGARISARRSRGNGRAYAWVATHDTLRAALHARRRAAWFCPA